MKFYICKKNCILISIKYKDNCTVQCALYDLIKSILKYIESTCSMHGEQIYKVSQEVSYNSVCMSVYK